MSTQIMAGGVAAMMGFSAAFFLMSILFYVYTALAMMITAQRLKKKNAWLAWIPIANLFLMAEMAGMDWWPILLSFGAFILMILGGVFNVISPFFMFITLMLAYVAFIVFLIYTFIWMWRICEARGKPGWWALLQLIPFVGTIWGLIMWGILAWGK